MNRLVSTLFLSMLVLSPAAVAQGSKSQAGGLPALSSEVAELRAMVEALQQQIGSEEQDPHVGTYVVTLIESGIFGCGTGYPQFPLTVPYIAKQATSSVMFRSTIFEAEADGSTLAIPEFELLSQELRLSGTMETEIRFEGDFNVAINSDGSLSYVDEEGETQLITGQISRDGSMFSILARGVGPEETCNGGHTVTLTGIKK